MIRSFQVFLIALLGVALLGGALSATHAAAPIPAVSNRPVCFVAGYDVACVDRAGLNSDGPISDQVRSLLAAMLAGPTAAERAAGVRSALPPQTELAEVAVEADRAEIKLSVPADFLASITDVQVESINQQVHLTLTPFNFKWLAVYALDADGRFRLISSFLKPRPLSHKERALPGAPSATSVMQPGGLAGKTVFVSAGHGWYYNATLNTYKTQRPVYPTSPYPAGEGVIEDFNNAEVVNQFLLRYLWNSGADAWTVRERDMNTAMIIVDNASAAFAAQGAWATNAGGYGGDYRAAATVTGSATATATWTFTPTTTGLYAVYLWFPGAAANRATDVHVSIEHAGATTPLTITQARDANNWRFLGDHPFYAGQAARVIVTNRSSVPGLNVLADAIRVGGGRGDVSLNGAPLSNRPRWEEQASQYAKWVGHPDAGEVSDVWIRPRYAEWEKESGEDAVYVSLHSNGVSGYTTARGTETYVYLTPTAGSTTLQTFVHDTLIDAIHAGWDAAWPDRGKLQRDLGEVGQLWTMPGILIENGFHDNPTDVEAMKDPRFAQLSARAIYHGLVKYWNSIDPSVPLVYLPEPPTRLTVRNSGAGQVTLNWQPGPTDGDGPLGDAAASYRVYLSADGFGWQNPIEVGSTTYTLTSLAPGELIYVKVTAVNAGGESFATPVLAARVAGNGLAPVLIVYGFERIDRLGDIQQNDPPEGLSRRLFVSRINRYDYIIQHAETISLPFDSALHGAVSDHAINLGNYAIVDWIAGEEQAPFPALTAADQSQLTAFLDAGGALFVSGAEIGYELKNTPFYANVLRAQYVQDDAGTYTAQPLAGGLFDGLGVISFDNGAHGTYDADWPDVFNPVNGSTAALVYNTGGPAGVQYANGCTRLVYLGFPFETIYPLSTRQAVMARVLDYLSACLPAELDTTILSPVDGSFVNSAPAFNGAASGAATGVEVSIRRMSDSIFYNGTTFGSSAEVWLNANSVSAWNYPLPALLDDVYGLRARSRNGSDVDVSPAAVTFTLDTVPPATPVLITPTGGISMLAVAPQFEWTGGGGPIGFEIALDGVTHTLYSPQLSARLIVTDGPHLWRARAFDAAGNQSGWSEAATFSTSSLKAYLPVAAHNFANETPPLAGSCSNLIVNGDFETGDFAGWSRPSQNPPAAVTADMVYAGQWSARMGKVQASGSITGFSSIQQPVLIPADALTATLSFARYLYSDDLDNLQYVAVISGTTVLDYVMYEKIDHPQWTTFQADLRPYAGRPIALRFSVNNKSAAGITGLIIDDVILNVCVP